MNDERRPDIDELLSLVEQPGPLPDGAEDALWASTAEFYERLLESSTTDPATRDIETEITMLAPNRNENSHRKRNGILAIAAALVVFLIVGLLVLVPGSDDSPEPVITQVPDTSVAPFVPGTGFNAIVWESDVDPTRVNATEGRPELVAGPLSMRVDSIVSTPGPDESQFCANAVEEGATDVGANAQVLPEVTSCLLVEYQFDVGADATNNAIVGAQPGVTTDGEEIILLTTDLPLGPPGGSAVGTAVFANLEAGSTISLLYEAQSEADGFQFGRWEFEVPAELQPIDWFDDEG